MDLQHLVGWLLVIGLFIVLPLLSRRSVRNFLIPPMIRLGSWTWPNSARMATLMKRTTICRTFSDGSSCTPRSSGFSESSSPIVPCQRLAKSPTALPTGSCCASSKTPLMATGRCLVTSPRPGGTRQSLIRGRSVLNLRRQLRFWRSEGGATGP